MMPFQTSLLMLYAIMKRRLKAQFFTTQKKITRQHVADVSECKMLCRFVLEILDQNDI